MGHHEVKQRGVVGCCGEMGQGGDGGGVGQYRDLLCWARWGGVGRGRGLSGAGLGFFTISKFAQENELAKRLVT